MNKRILALTVAVIIAIVLVGAYLLISLSIPAKVNITYSSKYGNTQYSSFNTYILFYMNVTTTKSCQFDFGKLQLTCNGQPITPIVGSGPNVINLKSNQINSVQLDYQVKGDVKGDFQLTYNGTSDITLSGLPSVAVNG